MAAGAGGADSRATRAPPAGKSAESRHCALGLELSGAPLQAACLEVLVGGQRTVTEIHRRVQRLTGRCVDRSNVSAGLRRLRRKGLVRRRKRQTVGDRHPTWVYGLAPGLRDVAPCDKRSHPGPCSTWSHRYRTEVSA